MPSLVRRCGLLLIAATLGGCCLGDPDLCQDVELAADAGPPVCWSDERTPLRTLAEVEGPAGALALLSCAAVADGACVEGPVAGRRHLHLPTGTWRTHAQSAGCRP